MFGAASTVDTNRIQNHLRHGTMAPVVVLMLTGICCWGIHFTRSHTSSLSRQESNAEVSVTTFSQLAGDEEAMLLKDDQHDVITSDGIDTHLKLQSVMVSPTRRIAMICDHLVSEGECLSLHGRSINVTSVNETGVELAVAGTQFHLPFALSNDAKPELPQD